MCIELSYLHVKGAKIVTHQRCLVPILVQLPLGLPEKIEIILGCQFSRLLQSKCHKLRQYPQHGTMALRGPEFKVWSKNPFLRDPPWFRP